MRKTLIFLLALPLLAACDALGQSGAPTPIFITATSQQFIIVTNTPTPSPSPVLAPTLPGQGSADGPAPTATLAVTLTPAITNTPTFTPTPTDTPVTPGAVIAPVGGVVAAGEVGNCSTTPSGGFGAIYTSNPELAAQIGCPVDNTASSVSSAYQTYERGAMVWLSSLGSLGQTGIYAIYSNGSYQRFNDTWVDGVDPVSIGAAPPAGLVEPIRGFGKVWRESPGVSDALGWGTSAEQGGSAFIQVFERGEMLYVPQDGNIYIFVSGQPGTWTRVTGSY